MDKYIALIGLGVVGAPLAHMLHSKYGDDFLLLSSKDFLHTLTDPPITINGDPFSPRIIVEREQLDKPIGVVFICVKNYHIRHTLPFIAQLIDPETILIPLQNGVFSYSACRDMFPLNPVLEGFAQGPNTIMTQNQYRYQSAGKIHIGASDSTLSKVSLSVYNLLKVAGVDCCYDSDIKRAIWKKLMLNVAGNAITAITGIDYCMFSKSPEVQDLCRKTMHEFLLVARSQGVKLTEKDINDVIDYYLSFTISKHTSMLEDVLNKRQTENEYIAGYVSKLAEENEIDVPNINMLYALVKIKEDVYMGRI